MDADKLLKSSGANPPTTDDSMSDLFAKVEYEFRKRGISITDRLIASRKPRFDRKFLGYTIGPNGELKIVPEEAEIVRKIFDLYVKGNKVREIKKYLEEQCSITVTGRTVWSIYAIDRILSNVRYIGQLPIQRTYTPGCRMRIQVKGDKKIETYYVENAHKPIIDKETFEKVQKIRNDAEDEGADESESLNSAIDNKGLSPYNRNTMERRKKSSLF